MAAWPLQVLTLACKSPAKNGCKAQSTGFVKKMSWLRNSVHFHYNVRVVRTTRIWTAKSTQWKERQKAILFSSSSALTHGMLLQATRPMRSWRTNENQNRYVKHFSLCAQPLERHACRCTGAQRWGTVISCDWHLAYVAHAESLKWYSLSANFEKLMFLPPTSIRVHTIAVCQSSPLIAWLHHFFTSFAWDKDKDKLSAPLTPPKTGFWIWDLIEWYWVI